MRITFAWNLSKSETILFKPTSMVAQFSRARVNELAQPWLVRPNSESTAQSQSYDVYQDVKH